MEAVARPDPKDDAADVAPAGAVSLVAARRAAAEEVEVPRAPGRAGRQAATGAGRAGVLEAAALAVHHVCEAGLRAKEPLG